MGFVGDVLANMRANREDRIAQRVVDLQKGTAPLQYRYDTTDQLWRATGYDGADKVASFLRLDQALMKRYADYETMDDHNVVSEAFDSYADEAVVPDKVSRKRIWVEADDEKFEKEFNRVLHKVLRVDRDAWPLARTIAKYGNVFGEGLFTPTLGCVGVNFLPAPTVRRIEDEKGFLLGFVQDETMKFSMNVKQAKAAIEGGQNRDERTLHTFEDWEVVHWRLRSKGLRSVYGTGVAESARWPWKRLILTEDLSLLHKLTRAGGRYAYYIDVGDRPDKEATNWVRKVSRSLKRKKFVDATGRVRYSPDVMSPDEDLIIPVRGDKDSTRVDFVGGNDYQSEWLPEYWLKATKGALKRPLNAEDMPTKESWAQNSVGFARAVIRVQTCITDGYDQLLGNHLAALGIDPSKVERRVIMTAPDAIFELARLEVLSATADVLDRYKEFGGLEWALKKIGGYSESETKRMIKGALEWQSAVRRNEADDEAYGAKLQASATGESVNPDALRSRKLARQLGEVIQLAEYAAHDRGARKDYRDAKSSVLPEARDAKMDKALGMLERLAGEVNSLANATQR